MGIGQFRKIHDLLCYDAFADAYSGNKEIRRNPMKRIIGYTVFWIAFGMTIAFLCRMSLCRFSFIFGRFLAILCSALLRKRAAIFHRIFPEYFPGKDRQSQVLFRYQA